MIALEGHNVTVCIDIQTFEKKKVPKWLREKLISYQKECESANDR